MKKTKGIAQSQETFAQRRKEHFAEQGFLILNKIAFGLEVVIEQINLNLKFSAGYQIHK